MCASSGDDGMTTWRPWDDEAQELARRCIRMTRNEKFLCMSSAQRWHHLENYKRSLCRPHLFYLRRGFENVCALVKENWKLTKQFLNNSINGASCPRALGKWQNTNLQPSKSGYRLLSMGIGANRKFLRTLLFHKAMSKPLPSPPCSAWPKTEPILSHFDPTASMEVCTYASD